METSHSIIARFPDREFEIRRRFATDPGFRSVCSDYDVALCALRRWQAAGKEKEKIADDYAGVVGELEDEIMAQLNR